MKCLLPNIQTIRKSSSPFPPIFSFTFRDLRNQSNQAANIFLKYGLRKGDPMLVYFTSGTTSALKMVLHNYAYPLGHVVTARSWWVR